MCGYWVQTPAPQLASSDLGSDLKLCEPQFSCLHMEDSGMSASLGCDEAP